MLTGGANFNTTDTTVGHTQEILAKRDSILASNRLDRYATARILGKRPEWHAQPKLPVLAPLDLPPPRPRRAGPITLPEIASAAADAFGVTVERMRASPKGRHGAECRAVVAACALSGIFSSREPRRVASFFNVTSSKSLHRWAAVHWKYVKDPIYKARYDAAKRALESLR